MNLTDLNLSEQGLKWAQAYLGFDHYYEHSDDGRVYRRGAQEASRLKAMFRGLPDPDKDLIRDSDVATWLGAPHPTTLVGKRPVAGAAL